MTIQLKTILGPFERRFRQKLQQGLSRREALGQAMEEAPEEHADYLRRFSTLRPADRRPCAVSLARVQANSPHSI